MNTDLAFHRPFDTRRLGASPLSETIEADETERVSIAAFLGILGVERLEAQLRFEPWSDAGMTVEGRLLAAVTQACVVTLEPVPQAIDETFRLSFLPANRRSADPRSVAEAEVIVHYDEDDPPEDLEGPVVDLGPYIVEQLALALDPYPRAEGAALSESAEDAVSSGSPFSALSKLRDM